MTKRTELEELKLEVQALKEFVLTMKPDELQESRTTRVVRLNRIRRRFGAFRASWKRAGGVGK